MALSRPRVRSVKELSRASLIEFRTKAFAETDDVQAQHDLACIYDETQPREPLTALQWYRISAINGHVESQKRLGFIYSMQRDFAPGVDRDFAVAKYWYSQAAKQYDAFALFSWVWLCCDQKADETLIANDLFIFKWYCAKAVKGDWIGQEKIRGLIELLDAMTAKLNAKTANHAALMLAIDDMIAESGNNDSFNNY